MRSLSVNALVAVNARLAAECEVQIRFDLIRSIVFGVRLEILSGVGFGDLVP